MAAETGLAVVVKANLSELREELAKGELLMATTKQKLGEMGNAFSGSSIISQASAAAKAIDDLGGVSKLTTEEQARANAIFSQASEKIDLLGQGHTQAAGKIREMAAATKQADESVTSQIRSTLEGIPIIGQFAAAMTAERVFEFAKGAFDSAAQIDNMSKASGISTDALQRMAFVGADAGLGLDDISKAAENLSTRLAHNDSSAVAAIQKMGLSVEDLKAVGPAELFLQVTEAAGRVVDPLQKGALTSDLFGEKVGRVLVPFLGELRARMDDVPRESIISPENIKGAADFDTALGHLTTTAKAVTVEGLSWLAEQVKEFNLRIMGVPPGVHAASASLDEHKDAVTGAGTAYGPTISNADLLNNRLQALRRDAATPLSDAQKQSALEARAWGLSLTEAAEQAKTSEIAVKLFYDATDKATESEKRVTEQTKLLRDAMGDLQSLGADLHGTLSNIPPVVTQIVEAQIRAGATANDLKVAWGLTDVEIKALTRDVEDHTRAIEEDAKKQAAIASTAAELHRAVSVASHNSVLIQIEDARVAADARIEQLRRTKTWTEEAEANIRAAFDQTQKNIIEKTLEQDVHTKEHYQALADEAQIAFEFAEAHAEHYSQSWIEQLRQQAVAAQYTADQWTTGFEGGLARVDAAIQRTHESAKSLMDFFSSSQPGFLAGPWNIDPTKPSNGSWLITPTTISNPVTPPPTHRASGGPVVAGQSYIVGEKRPELFVPQTNGTIVPSIGATGGAVTTINVSVNVSGSVLSSDHDLARVVGDAFMAKLRSAGVRLPVGI